MPERDVARVIDAAIEKVTQDSASFLSDDAIEVIDQFILDATQTRLDRGDPVATEIRRRVDRFARGRVDPLETTARLLFGGMRRRDGLRDPANRPPDRNRDDDRGKRPADGPPMGIGDGMRWGRPSGGGLTDAERRELQYALATLVPSAAMDLNRLAGDDDRTRAMVLDLWVDEAIRRRWRERFAPDEQRAYMELSGDQRDRVDLLPPDEFFRELNRPQF